MFKSDNTVFGVSKEASLRKTSATLDAPITAIYAIDEPTAELTFPVPELTKENVDRIGDGRLGGKTQDTGYDLADETNEFAFQTGYFLDYVLGDTTTLQINDDGVDYDAFTPTAVVYAVSSIADTRMVYVCGEDVDGKLQVEPIQLDGDTPVAGQITFVAGKLYGCFVLTSDAVAVITIQDVTPSVEYLSILVDVFTSAGTLTDKYFHRIIPANDLPSHGIHAEWRNETGANDKINDFVGIQAKSLEIVTEIKSKTKQNVGWSCCRMIDSDAQQDDDPTLNPIDQPAGLDVRELGWDDLKILELKYNNADIITNFEDFVKSIGVSFTNEYVVDQVMGNEWPKKYHASSLDVTIALSYYPTIMTLFNLKETHSKDYLFADTTCLQLFLQWQRYVSETFTDKYQIEVKRLKVNTHDKIQKPPGETIDLIAECELGKFGKNDSGIRYRAKIEVLIIDDKDENFYSN
jgi:hypothetical protein